MALLILATAELIRNLYAAHGEICPDDAGKHMILKGERLYANCVTGRDRNIFPLATRLAELPIDLKSPTTAHAAEKVVCVMIKAVSDSNIDNTVVGKVVVDTDIEIDR